MAKSKKVASLIEKKCKISQEIKDLQDKCTHLNKSLKSIPESVDSSTFVIRRVCGDCDKIIGMPTQHEIFEFLNGTR